MSGVRVAPGAFYQLEAEPICRIPDTKVIARLTKCSSGGKGERA